jgi:hypothetical protein
MTEFQQQAAIRTKIWLGKNFITRSPLPVQVTPKRFETKTRTQNLGTRIDRVFTTAGMPNIRNRREFVLPWETIIEPEILEHLDILTAIGQPFGFGLWKHETDVFDGDGVSTTFYLQRRQLLPSVVPQTEFPDYPTRIIVYDLPYTDPAAVATPVTVIQTPSVDMDTGGPSAGEAWVENEGSQIGNLWVTRVRLGTPPPAAFDCLVAIYLPFYEVVVDAEAPRSYAQALREPRTIRLWEFG